MSAIQSVLPRLRVLLAHHASCNDGVAGGHLRRLLEGLTRLGHQVRLLTIERQRVSAPTYHRPILADALDTAAEIHFAPPTFPVPESAARAFHDLTHRELLDYRDTLREILDDEIHSFNPHLIHAQHAWLLAHLALEAGVPYVATVWSDELHEVRRDERFLRVGHEAAENAGQLIVNRPALKQQLLATFTAVDPERVVTLADDDPAWIEHIEKVYRTALVNRFGEHWRP